MQHAVRNLPQAFRKAPAALKRSTQLLGAIQTQTRTRTRWLSTRGAGGGGMVDILHSHNADEKPRMSVRGYGEECFQVNETHVHGSCIILPHSFFIWEAKTFEDITKESLGIFTMLHPTIEVLFIGCGDVMPKPLDAALVRCVYAYICICLCVCLCLRLCLRLSLHLCPSH